MPKASQRLRRTAAIVVATGMLLLGTATAANAGTAKPSVTGPPVVQVVATTADGVTLPDRVHSGIVTFRFSQGDADFHAIQGFRLKPGGSLDSVMQGFSDALLGDFATRVIGVAEINAGATLIGGSLIFPGASMDVTVSLTRGTYYFFDYNDVGVITPRISTIQAVGDFRIAPLPSFNQVIVATMENGLPRFITPTTMSATQTFFFFNGSDEDHEVMFRPAVAGTTDDYITTFYNAVLAGGPRPPSPWTDIQHGLQPVSPGLWAIVHIDLPPGLYAEICYVPDDQTGIPHAYEGMHVVINLN